MSWQRSLMGFLDDFKRVRSRAIWADHPQRAAQAIWPLCLWTGHGQPFLVDHVRFLGIDIHITIGIFIASRFNGNLLVPAMHATDRVWMNGKGEILMHSALAPEDACRVWIVACKRLNAR